MPLAERLTAFCCAETPTIHPRRNFDNAAQPGFDTAVRPARPYAHLCSRDRLWCSVAASRASLARLTLPRVGSAAFPNPGGGGAIYRFIDEAPLRLLLGSALCQLCLLAFYLALRLKPAPSRQVTRCGYSLSRVACPASIASTTACSGDLRQRPAAAAPMKRKRFNTTPFHEGGPLRHNQRESGRFPPMRTAKAPERCSWQPTCRMAARWVHVNTFLTMFGAEGLAGGAVAEIELVCAEPFCSRR